MSVATNTAVEFERREAHLSELDSDPPYTIHGVAIGEGDVTKGSSGIKKYWPGEELKEAAESLQGTNLVVDHDNTANGVVGRVTKAGYKDGVGVLYEAQLFDKDYAEKISNGLLEVSIRGFHNDVEEMDETEEGAKIVEDVEFDNLSIVPTGAAPSNTLQMGEHAELSPAELAAATEDFESVDILETSAVLQEVEPGDFVQWEGGDMHGVVIGMSEGDAEVDIYEKDDDTWRPIGETTTVGTGSLESWDVDEDNIGPMQDDEEDEEDDEEENEASDSMENEEELQETEVHRPEFSGTTESDWSKPALEDFGEDPDMSEVADHFLVSVTGFPPENFGDLALPVVEPNGDLNLNALQNAKARAGQVDGLSGDNHDRVVSIINSLANEEFDADFEENEESEEAEEAEEAAKHHHQATADQIDEFLDVEGNSRETFVSAFLEWADNASAQKAVDEYLQRAGGSLQDPVGDLDEWLQRVLDADEARRHGDEDNEEEKEEMSQDDGTTDAETLGPVSVLTGDDLWQRRKSRESEQDSITTLKVTNMTELSDELLAELEDLDEPVVAEQDEVEELREKAEQYDDISEDISELRERTEVLDDVSREKVDELADAEDPLVVESARHEELKQEAQQVKEVYAANLADEVEFFDSEELTEKFDIDELREKHEEHVGELEEELSADPDPKSEDPSEEELEEQSGSDDEDEVEELSDEVKAKQEELRGKILDN